MNFHLSMPWRLIKLQSTMIRQDEEMTNELLIFVDQQQSHTTIFIIIIIYIYIKKQTRTERNPSHSYLIPVIIQTTFKSLVLVTDVQNSFLFVTAWSFCPLSICVDILTIGTFSPWAVVIIIPTNTIMKKKSIKTCYFDNPDVNSFLINIIKVDKCFSRPVSNSVHVQAHHKKRRRTHATQWAYEIGEQVDSHPPAFHRW